MEFMLGCNYWASNAGTEMWREWDEDSVRRDIKTLSENGSKFLRVFPNWRDFQPATRLYGFCGMKREIVRMDGEEFTNEYYLDEIMLERFGTFCDICDEYDIKLVVGILTGWMSGRLFVPPVLENTNLYTDALALRLEYKFIRGFVTEFKNRDCIIAWDLGNECNCMSETDSRDTAAVWTAGVSNAIKASDNTRPVISGMHSLSIENTWTIKDQAEYCDILTTHPYPQFVEHCFRDGMLSFRTLMHLPAETKLYQEIGGRPCFPEELGTLGPMSCDCDMAANFLKVSAYQSWINGFPGFMWWCGCEQAHLETAPYVWNMMERELGLMDVSGNPKKALIALKEVYDRIKSFDSKLSPPETDVVCITSKGQDNWGISYMSYALARQTGLNLRFAYSCYDIPESDFYMLPSIYESEVMPKKQYFELKKRVYEGASLYISNDAGYLTEFSEFCGNSVHDTVIADDICNVKIGDNEFILERSRRHVINPLKSEVLGCDNMGIPALTVHSYGMGKVYYLNFPLEKMLLKKEQAFDENYSDIYRIIFKDILDKKPVKSDNKNVGITYHGDKIAMINYSDAEQEILVNGENISIKPYDLLIKDIL